MRRLLTSVFDVVENADFLPPMTIDDRYFNPIERPYYLAITRYGDSDDPDAWDDHTALGPYADYEGAKEAKDRLQERESVRHGYTISVMYDPEDEVHLHV